MTLKQYIRNKATYLCYVLIAYILTMITRRSRNNCVYFSMKVIVCCVCITYVMILILSFESAYFAWKKTALI